MPYVSFVESAGADLRSRPTTRRPQGQHHPLRRERPVLLRAHRALQDEDPDGLRGLRSSTAGGAYQPGLSDYNIVVKGQSKIFSPGHPWSRWRRGRSPTTSRSAVRRSTPRSPASATISPRTRWTRCASAGRWSRTSTGARPGPRRCSRRKSPPMTPRSCSAGQPGPAPAGRRARRHRPGGRRIPVRGVQGPLRPHRRVRLTRIHGYPVGVLGNNG